MGLQIDTEHHLAPASDHSEIPKGRRSRRFWYGVFGVGILALAAGGGTFASFSAETDNPNNTFSTGSLLLSNQVQSGTVCFSYGGASNVNAGCDVVINSTGHKPGESATSLGTLGTALTNGASVSSLSVAALPVAVPQGALLILNLGSNSQLVTTRASAGVNATSISVVPFTANFAYTTSTTVTLSPFVSATVTIGNVGTINGGTLTLSSTGCTSSQVNNFTFNSGNLCSDAEMVVQEVGQGTVTTGGVYSPSTNNTYCWFGAQGPVPPYPSPAAGACDANPADSGLPIGAFESAVPITLSPLSGIGTTTSGTPLQSLHARQFVVGLYLPSGVGNADQSLQAVFPLSWTISQ